MASASTQLRRWLKPPRRLKFTRLGTYFTGMTLLVGFGAINTGNNLLYLLLGMMLALIVVSGVLSEQVIQRLNVKHRLPNRIFAGHPTPIEILVDNPRPRVPSFSIEIVERVADLPPARRPAAYFMRVDAGGEAHATVRFAFPRRGRVKLEGFEVVTHFPFGLFRKSREIDAEEELLVYPQPLDPGPLTGLADLPQGEVRHPRPGRGGDYYGLRDYRQGDDLRDVHWKLVAKRGDLVLREREKEEARRLTIAFPNAWPQDHADPAHAIERAIATCAGLAQRLIADGYVVALATLDGRVPYGSGAAQLDRILRELALLRLHGDPRPLLAPPPHDGPLALDLDAQRGDACVLVTLPGEATRWSRGRVLAVVTPQEAP